ncbi:MAG: hypothetical protein IJ689_07765 [Alphaproteobacteria bacterium]|nr:hypothetical protein [Alphaproteobacteria bacterium]MBR1649472.1 hypothetical protein [Alphaproteobacteria bacterium]
MTNKTFLTLLLLGVSYTAYNAAAVSENFAISTTIDHEITLGNFKTSAADPDVRKKGDLNMGTIYVNPNATKETPFWYDSSGIFYKGSWGDAIVSADNATVGTFTANIPNPSDCIDSSNQACGGLLITGTSEGYIGSLFGGSDGNGCYFYIDYSESSEEFKVYPGDCMIMAPTTVTKGVHTGTLTISYTPS